MTSYFYCCPMPLAVGSVVHPRNWERILRTYNQQTFSAAWLMLVSELVYELIRRERFPMKPSRLHCLFLCTSPDGLAKFRASSGRLRDIGYEVELVNPREQSHFGDWTLPNIRATDTIATITRNALLYWRGISIANPELATLSPIRVTRRLQPHTRWRRGRQLPYEDE